MRVIREGSHLLFDSGGVFMETSIRRLSMPLLATEITVQDGQVSSREPSNRENFRRF